MSDSFPPRDDEYPSANDDVEPTVSHSPLEAETNDHDDSIEDAEQVETDDGAEWADAMTEIDRSIEEISRVNLDSASSASDSDAEYQPEAASQGLDYQPQSVVPTPEPAEGVVLTSASATQRMRTSESGGVQAQSRCSVEQRVPEELERVWRHTFNPSEGAPPEAVVITGVSAGDGATHVAAALALIGARSNREHRVALVDFNLRSFGLAPRLGLAPLVGLSDVLTRGISVEDVVQQVLIDSAVLDVLPAGSRVEEPRGLIKSEKTKALIDELRRRYDFLIIDAAPADAYPDATVLGALADGVLLISRGESTMDRTSFVYERLELAGVRRLGLVLNQSHTDRRGWK